MFETATVYLWNKTPGYVKYPLVFIFVLMILPIKIKDYVDSYFVNTAQAVIKPFKDQHDLEIKSLRDNLGDVKSDVRAIGVHLMGEARLSQMSKQQANRDEVK